MASGLTRRELGRATLAGAALAGLGGAGLLAGCGSGEGEDSAEASKQDVIDRLPSMGIPKPVDYIRTDWSHDPLALCSYSYLAPSRYGSTVRRMLAEPFGRVVIAGEATARIPATVHGAIGAGREVAALVGRELGEEGRVAVIGAGAAGLACAGALEQGGLRPVLIEASGRVGGRVRSGELAGSPVELGASWIHGVEGNPLTDLADAAGVGLHPFGYEPGFPVPGQRALADAGERRLFRAIDSFDPEVPGARLRTVDWLLPYRWGPGLQWAVQNEIAQEYGADADRLAALATWEGGWLGGGDALLDGPYASLLGGLAGNTEIRLDSPVSAIHQGSEGVTVSAAGGEIEADAAVVTVPIGVLKAGTIEFTPQLPARTRTAIETLGAGLLDKVWLAFEEPFWEREVEGFAWIDPRRPGRWGSWVNSVPVNGKPFLLTLSGGGDAHRLARRSDLEVVGGAMAALQSMFAG
ncbi:MAG: FAD-dependent oxidoreductase [Solirubrobacterales bacterium]|nr:FAD-dependent oxidoreductase [Solirubrobacterales bacterium]MCB0861265.1 FAD-dependent oxidoreductase [Solirubrobacterales bacterium]